MEALAQKQYKTGDVVECAQCGKEYGLDRIQARRLRNRLLQTGRVPSITCSIGCRSSIQRKPNNTPGQSNYMTGNIVKCAQCGEDYKLTTASAHRLRSGLSFPLCSRECVNISRRKYPIMRFKLGDLVNCHVCDRQFALKNYQLLHAGKVNKYEFCCSRVCVITGIRDKANTALSKSNTRFTTAGKETWLTFPVNRWDSKFMYYRVQLDKITNQAQIIGCLWKESLRRKLFKHGRSYRISLPEAITPYIDMGAIDIADHFGVTITLQLYDPNCLAIFEHWSKSTAHSTNDLILRQYHNTRTGKDIMRISFAQFLCPDWFRKVRLDRLGTILLIRPVISGGSLSLVKRDSRFSICADKFITANPNTPLGEYEYIGKTRDGALKFKPIITDSKKLKAVMKRSETR